MNQPIAQTETEVRTLTTQITQLAERLIQDVKDADNRQAMNTLVAERKTRLKQIKEVDMPRYVSLAQELGVRA